MVLADGRTAARRAAGHDGVDRGCALALVVIAVLGTRRSATFLDVATNSTVPYADAATTNLSLVAQFLLTRKYIESWPVWIFGVNLPFIAIYLYKGLAMTAGLQLVFIALSIAGWRAWRRSMARRRAAERPRSRRCAEGAE